jgi:hypothetical protein
MCRTRAAQVLVHTATVMLGNGMEGTGVSTAPRVGGCRDPFRVFKSSESCRRHISQ